MTACKHLDHDPERYPTCTLVQLDTLSSPVKYWYRNEVPYPEAPRKVQFCGQGRGRINGIFQCYNKGEMPCYEPVQEQNTAESCKVAS